MTMAKSVNDTEEDKAPAKLSGSSAVLYMNGMSKNMVLHRALRHPLSKMFYLCDATSHADTNKLLSTVANNRLYAGSRTIWFSADNLRPGHVAKVLIDKYKKLTAKNKSVIHLAKRETKGMASVGGLLGDWMVKDRPYIQQTQAIDLGVCNSIFVHPSIKTAISDNVCIQFAAVSLTSDGPNAHVEAIRRVLHRNLPVHIPEAFLDHALAVLTSYGYVTKLDAVGDIEGTLFDIHRATFFDAIIGEILGQVDVSVIDIQDFMMRFGKASIDAVRNTLKPVHQQDDPNMSRLLGQVLKRRLIPSQARCVQAAVQGYRSGERSVLLGAEMSTGKTITALAIMRMLEAQRTIITLPPQLIDKWGREAMATLPNISVVNLNDGFSTGYILRQARMGFPVEQPTIYMIGRTRTRLEERIEPAYAKKMNYAAMKDLLAERNELELDLYDAKLDGDASELIENLEERYTRSKKLCEQGIFMPICPHCGTRIMITKVVDHKTKTGRIVRKRMTVEAEIEDLENNRDLHCLRCHTPMRTHRPILNRYHDHQLMRREMMISWLSGIPGVGEQRAGDILFFHGVDELARLIFAGEFDNLAGILLGKRSTLRTTAIEHMRAAPFTLTHAAIPPFKALKRTRGKQIDLLVSDEAHENKADDSQQGIAFGTMCGIARKTLMLSGTIMGGYAKDLFPLLFRGNPRAMKNRGYRHSGIGNYQANEGMLEEIVKVKNDKPVKTVRPIAGYSASAIAHDLLPRSVFMYLSDIERDIKTLAAQHGLDLNILPSYREQTIRVSMNKQQKSAYEQLLSASRKALMSDEKGVRSRVVHGMLAALDRPNLITETYSTTIQPWVKDGELAPKEAELIKLVQREKAQGRRVLVYVNYTQKLDCQNRLQSVLEQAGFRTKVLRASSGITSEEREAWVLKQVEEGLDVLISHPRLVATGLDLPFPTIVNLQINESTFVIRQANRRSRRIGFTDAVRVYYLVYANTVQELRLSFMAAKIRTALDTEGDCSASALDTFLNDDDSSIAAVARALVTGEKQEVPGAIDTIEDDNCSGDYQADIDHLPTEAELIAMANAKNDVADIFGMFA